MDILDEEILKFWKLLQEEKVEYIMVGGFATNLHGFARTTADADIWLKDTIENRKKFRAVLKKLDIGDFEEIETIELVPGWSTIYLNSGLELDIMTYLKGFPKERFDECYQLAFTANIHDVQVKFLHLNHLLESKKATARPKDLLDVEELERIKKLSGDI